MAKVGFFQDVYRAKWFGRRWNDYVWRTAFTGSATLHLPLEEKVAIVHDDSGQFMLILYLRAAGPRGTRKHRVFVTCPECFKKIPAGRIHQHSCKEN